MNVNNQNMKTKTNTLFEGMVKTIVAAGVAAGTITLANKENRKKIGKLLNDMKNKEALKQTKPKIKKSLKKLSK